MSLYRFKKKSLKKWLTMKSFLLQLEKITADLLIFIFSVLYKVKNKTKSNLGTFHCEAEEQDFSPLKFYSSGAYKHMLK